HALGALLVAQEPLQRTIPRPPAIAVHDDGHMFGQALRLQRRIYCALLGGQVMDALRTSRIQGTRLNVALADSRLASPLHCAVGRVRVEYTNRIAGIYTRSTHLPSEIPQS